jgi:HAE1 family hydrophobic/amphiphilic exporter-1
MSNIAIVVSMIPMALGAGAGGTFRAPFAITAIGGVIVSTILTVFVIPVLYVWTAPKHEEEVL